MSHLYDELKILSKQSGKSMSRMARDMQIPAGTVNKWRTRAPHSKYKTLILSYIENEQKNLRDKAKSSIFSKNTGTIPTTPSKPNDDDSHLIPTDFWKKLEAIYLTHANGNVNWSNEINKLRELIPALAHSVAGHYRILSPIDHGGTGIILRVHDEKLGVDRALKFPRPVEQHQELFKETIGTEINYLLEAHHRNIVEIYYHDQVTLSSGTFPFYIMEFIRGAQSARKYFSTKRTARELIDIFIQVVDGVKHLHSLDIVHFDIKPDNILLSEDGEALISDLGSARKHDESEDEVTIIYTRHYAHPRLTAKRSQTTSDSNRSRSSIKRKEIEQAFDIYAFGKTIFELVQTFDPHIVTERMKPYERKYLLLMASRCLDGENASSETALGLPISSFNELKYRSFTEISDDLSKLTGQYPLYTLLPELNPYILDTVQTSSNFKTPLTPRLKKVLAHPAVQRLAGVSQLGLLIHVYPTATHTRLQHTLGVFSNAIRIIGSLYNDPINPLFKQIMTIDDMECLLLSALFHDLGHFPLAHDLHEALPAVFDHESVAVSILRDGKSWFSGNSLRTLIRDDWSVDPARIANIIKAHPNDNTQPIKDRILHTIISGPVDADKLDYLIRDAKTLGIPYARVVDLERLLSSLTVIFSSVGINTYAALGIHEKGKFSAESVAFARYAMFGAVYWHHTSRAIKSMLHRSIWESIVYKFSGPNGESNLQVEFQTRFLEAGKRDMFEGEILSPMTQVLPSDREILGWIYNSTTEKGKTLIKMINNRELFKRICVISKSDRDIWKALSDFRGNTDDWEKLIKLQNQIQKDVVDMIKNLSPENRERNSTLTVDKTDVVIQMDKEGHILFLLDIPTQRPMADTSLKYLPESARKSLLDNWDAPVGLEESHLWKEINDGLLGLAGKIRLYCHPMIADVVTASVDRESLERIIDGSLGYIKTGKLPSLLPPKVKSSKR